MGVPLRFLQNNIVTDAPVFVNLENNTFNADDLFAYTIDAQDEENNVPFKFNISITKNIFNLLIYHNMDKL